MAKEPIDVTEKVEELKGKKFAVSLPIAITIFTLITGVAAGYYELKTKFDGIVEADYVSKADYVVLENRLSKLEERVFQSALNSKNGGTTTIVVPGGNKNNSPATPQEKKSKW